MKENTKRISCYLIVILLTLLVPFTMVLAEETEKNMEETDYSEPITTVGAMDDSDGEIPTIGAEEESDGEVPTVGPGTESNRSTIDESAPITDAGNNPASVDDNQIIVPLAIGGAVVVAIIITSIVVKSKKKSE